MHANESMHQKRRNSDQNFILNTYPMEKSGYFLETDRIFLRELRPEDVDAGYYAWMNDPAVTDQLESRFFPHTKPNLTEYIRSYDGNNKNLFLAIVEKKINKHIGNIKLGPINWIHRFANIGIIIGEKDYWGKGYAAEAIQLLIHHAFDTLNLRKLTAGAYVSNEGSIRAFQKLGFEIEGEEKEQYFYKGKYVSVVRMGLLKKNHSDEIS